MIIDDGTVLTVTTVSLTYDDVLVADIGREQFASWRESVFSYPCSHESSTPTPLLLYGSEAHCSTDISSWGMYITNILLLLFVFYYCVL